MEEYRERSPAVTSQCYDHAVEHSKPTKALFHDLYFDADIFGKTWDRNFVTFTALKISSHAELHQLAVHLGLNIHQYATILGKVSDNLLTKSILVLQLWRTANLGESERKCLLYLREKFRRLRRHDIAHEISVQLRKL